MRFSVALVDVERIGRRLTHFRIRFERWHVGVREPKPRFRNAGPRATELRIPFQRALEKFQAALQRFFRTLIGIKKTL